MSNCSLSTQILYNNIFRWENEAWRIQPESKCHLRIYQKGNIFIGIAEQLNIHTSGVQIMSCTEHLASIVYYFCKEHYGLINRLNFKWIEFDSKEANRLFGFVDTYSLVEFEWFENRFVSPRWVSKTIEEVREIICLEPPKSEVNYIPHDKTKY